MEFKAKCSDRDFHVDAMIPTSEVQTSTTYKKWSNVWNEFLILEGNEYNNEKKRVQCMHCKLASFMVASYYDISKMTKHLEYCEPYQWSLKSGGNNTFVLDQKIYRELVAKAIIKHGYDFSWVEHEGNREIHTYLNNRVKTICRNTATFDVLKMHVSLKTQLKDTLRNIPGRICLTSDMWTSCQTEGYLCLTAHYVDHTWKLNSRVLNFRHIEPPHIAQNLYGAVVNLIYDWGIEHKIFSITLDNASGNDKMQEYLRSILKDQGFLLYDGLFFHIQCAADVLNFVVQSGLEAIKGIVTKIRESVKYVKWSETRKFQICVKLTKISETKSLWLDVPTRWSSTYLMLDRALLYRKAFKELSLIDPLYKYFPEPKEWEMVEMIRDILEPLYDINSLFSGGDYPTSNLYFENLWKIAMLLKELAQNKNDDLRRMAIDMKGKFDKYWANKDDDDYIMLFAFGVILDPRCKLPFLKYCYQKWFENERESVLKIADVRFKLRMLLNEYTPKSNNASSRTSSTSNISRNGTSGNRKRRFDFLADFDKEEATRANLEKTKLDLYLEDPKEEFKMEFDILEFWKNNEHRYAELSYLARDILSVPLTTVASESTFSIGGRVLNKWRGSYLPENVEALITTRTWLYGYESTMEDEFVGSDVEWSSTKALGGDPS